MAISDEFIQLIAQVYYEAALQNADMRDVTEALETIRSAIVKRENKFKIWDSIDQYIGQAENESFRKVFIEFRSRFRQQFLTNETVRLREAFSTSPDEGWIEWLRAYAEAFSFGRLKCCLKLSEEHFPFQADVAPVVERIRQSTRYAVHDRWPEVYDTIIYLADQECIPKSLRTSLLVVAAEIQLYYFYKLDDAKDLLKRGEELDPGNSRVICGFGKYSLQQNEFDKVKEYSQEAISRDPLLTTSYTLMGDSYDRQNKLDNAEEWYRKAISKKSGDSDGYLGLLRLYGRPEMFAAHEADLMPLLNRAISVDPAREYNAYIDMGHIYQQNRQYPKGHDWYDRAIKLDGTRIGGYTSKGYSYLEEKNYDGACDSFQRAIKLAPEAFDGYWGMAWLYERKGSLEDALQWYELSLPKRPNWEGIIRGKIGEIKLKQGKYEEAREEIALAYQVDKNEDVYRRTMATIFNAEGNECYSQTDYGKAIEKYERAIEFNPKDEIFHSNLAGAWEKLSDPGKKVDALGNAISALQQAHELNPDDRDYIEKISRLQRKKSIAEHFGEKALDRFLVVTPIAVEVAGNLIPCVESETESGLHPTLNRLIGIMRKDINNTSGISIPGIRFRGNEDLPAGTYNIIMNEIPLVSGTILEEKRLFPGPMANLTPLGVFGEETDNPLTGDKAVWIKREDWKKVELSKQALWEVIEYMVRHLEAVIRRNLDEFFGHQEIMTKLSPYDDIYKNMQDTPADLTACTMVMKGLLNEGVPIIEFEKLVERFNESRKDKKNLLTIIDTIRSLPEVKTTLPGNNDQYSFYRLGQRFEEEVKKSVSIEDYLPFLATKPLIIQKALTAVRRKIGSNRNVALFVENAELRPFVRQLIEIEFPLVPVLSRMELLPDLEGKITGEIELE